METYFIVLNFMFETWTCAVAEPPKRKSIGLLLDTQSYKQSQKKINTLQESEQGSTEESGAQAAPITDIIVFFQRISDTLLFCEAKISFYQHSFPTPKRNKNTAKCLDPSTWRTLRHKYSLCRKWCCASCINWNCAERRPYFFCHFPLR